ncbi:MAG: hypothetical protein ACK5MU_01745 [Candidatus Saccharimonadales bacterium]
MSDNDEKITKTAGEEVVEKTEKTKTINGGRNLALLGLFAVVVAVVASAISLSIYHATGDIYLDRSRPGFISEGETDTTNKDKEKTYVFSPDGSVTEDVVDEYLEELEKIEKEIVDAADAFSPTPLSDEALGISE